MKMTKTLAWALLLAPALALAEPKTPDDWYKEGETQYNIGKFDAAVEAFKKGFELETNETKRPAYLFNVAQAYRQAKNCKDAVFFYRRYLALKDNDKVKPLSEKKRAEIDKIIEELDECAKQQEALTKKPPVNEPDHGTPVKPPVVAVVPTPEHHDDDGGDVTKPAPMPAPKLISVRALVGAAKISTGDLDVPVRTSLGLIGGYPLALNEQLTLELGAAFVFSPISYSTGNASGSAQLISALANVGASYVVADRISVRGDVGLGALVFSGVSGSPFTNGAATTGALTMFGLRLGVSGDYAITPNLVATIAPLAFSYSPAKAGLRADITSITQLQFMLGLGYRM
jgi:tetratricopeptide (TPR) repeat protein